SSRSSATTTSRRASSASTPRSASAAHACSRRWPRRGGRMAFFGKAHTRGHIVAEINVTPLTDVFLVLLIIFMITTSAMVKRPPPRLAVLGPRAPRRPKRPPAGRTRARDLRARRGGGPFPPCAAWPAPASVGRHREPRRFMRDRDRRAPHVLSILRRRRRDECAGGEAVVGGRASGGARSDSAADEGVLRGAGAGGEGAGGGDVAGDRARAR